MSGFEFKYDKEMPKENDWIEVVGTIELLKNYLGNEYPVINATTVVIKDVRGRELVSN